MEQRVEKILHPLGFEAGSDYCLRYTLGLARKHQAKLVLLHIINRSRPSVNLLFNLTLSAEEKEKFRNSQRDYAARRIRFDVDRLCLHDFGLDAKIDEILEAIIIEEGWPGDVIVAKAREYGCDAICIGTQTAQP